jgi:hypothetical protein
VVLEGLAVADSLTTLLQNQTLHVYSVFLGWDVKKHPNARESIKEAQCEPSLLIEIVGEFAKVTIDRPYSDNCPNTILENYSKYFKITEIHYFTIGSENGLLSGSHSYIIGRADDARLELFDHRNNPNREPAGNVYDVNIYDKSLETNVQWRYTK